MITLFSLVLFTVALASGDRCRMKEQSMYPPPANTTISWVTINMDLAPEVPVLYVIVLLTWRFQGSMDRSYKAARSPDRDPYRQCY